MLAVDTHLGQHEGLASGPASFSAAFWATFLDAPKPIEAALELLDAVLGDRLAPHDDEAQLESESDTPHHVLPRNRHPHRRDPQSHERAELQERPRRHQPTRAQCPAGSEHPHEHEGAGEGVRSMTGVPG